MVQPDWVEWHRDYDDPGSLLSRRGELVKGHLRAKLDRAPAGEVRLVSLCAGQGRDVIGVLTGTASCRSERTGWRASPPRWRPASACSPSQAELS